MRSLERLNDTLECSSRSGFWILLNWTRKKNPYIQILKDTVHTYCKWTPFFRAAHPIIMIEWAHIYYFDRFFCLDKTRSSDTLLYDVNIILLYYHCCICKDETRAYTCTFVAMYGFQYENIQYIVYQHLHSGKSIYYINYYIYTDDNTVWKRYISQKKMYEIL